MMVVGNDLRIQFALNTIFIFLGKFPMGKSHPNLNFPEFYFHPLILFDSPSLIWNKSEFWSTRPWNSLSMVLTI